MIQIDFHVDHEFTENDDYIINEGPNTYDVELHWIFPEASYLDYYQFEYHPDITDTTTFNASFSHIAEYATESDFKSRCTEEFQFYPNEYNFTEFTFTEFDDAYYEVTLNLANGGDFQGRYEDVEPFGMLIQTESGERYLDSQLFFSWQNISATEPIFTFNMAKIYFTSLGILEDSEVLVTYYYKKESLSYYAQYDNILTGPAYDFIIKDSDGNKIFTVGNLSSIKGNNITFTENIKNYLDIGENFTIQYDFKTIGGLLDTKHLFIEVQPYHMKFYNNYYPFSGASIISALYYNLSANYQYQMALNYRLQEKSMISLEFKVEEIGELGYRYFTEFDLDADNIPQTYSDDTPMAVAYFINSSGDQVYIKHQHINLDLQDNKLIINITEENKDQGLDVLATVYVSFYADLHNKYQYYHSFTIDLANDQINLLNWTTTQSPENTLMANYESSHFIYDVDPYESISKGKVQQVFAILNDTNSLIYHVTEDLNDATNGWNSFDTLIMKMGFLNPDVLDYLNVSFYYNTTPSQDELIGWTEVSLDMFEDDSGTMYITLPVSSDWDKFTITNDARIMFTPVFNNATEFNGDFYGQGLPTTQTIEWDSSMVSDGYLNVDLLRKIFSNTSTIWVLNDLLEPIYEIPFDDIDTKMEEYEIYDNRRSYEVEYNNISLPEFYNDTNGNIIYLKNGDILYIKYNATLLSSIGMTVDEMVLQRAPFIKNYDTGANDVPFTEISLLGVIDEASTYTIDDIYSDRDKLVAWEDALDLTPFESEFYDTYQQKVFNISFDDIDSSFKVLDSEGIENCYITDVMITSNDPRYEIVVDSFFIFEFDYNATLYDSEIFDLYPNNHLEEFYYGDFTDIYSEVQVLDASEFLPLYSNDHDINETLYFDAFDSDGNWFYFNSHLFAQNTSSGVYDITFNPEYSEEYYLRYLDSQNTQVLVDLYEYYVPHVANFSYLYISWADANAWKEWRTIATPNVNISTIDVMFEWYDDTTEDYESVSYNQILGEFEARNIAIETIYPFDSPTSTDIFNLSQSYSSAQDLDIMMVKGYFFNESFIDFDPDISTTFKFDAKCLEISTLNGRNLHVFEKIVVYINFTSGAYSDYAQFRLLDNALTNNPEAPLWTKNDTLYVDYEYNDIDYFLLMEEYTVGSEDSMFEYFNYTRNDKFMIENPVDSSFYLNMTGREEDFQNFTRENDPKTVLEFLDFDEDGSHEIVVQKDDITMNGIFDSFKYGFINPAGEITFHTLVQEVTETQVQKEKTSDVKISEEFEVKAFYSMMELSDKMATVQRRITTNSTIETRLQRWTTLIQKDLDYDGYIDEEVSYEELYSTSNSIVFTEEITSIRWKDDIFGLYETWKVELKEYRNSTYTVNDMSLSYVFRDFDFGRLVSTRYYDDVFPNELSEMYELYNNLHIVVNDLDDDDPSNDIITQAPALEQLLARTHSKDGVSEIFDRNINITSVYSLTGELLDTKTEVSNSLTTQKVISIPGSHDVGSSISDYMNEEQVTLEVIEVIPPDGVYYDNSEDYNPNTLKDLGYKYYFFDEDNDGKATMVFIVNPDGEVKGVGFDYDGDAIFNPDKTLLVEKHIIESDASGSATEERPNTLSQIIDNEFIHYTDADKYDGMFLESTFRDSLFDTWKTQYTDDTSLLMEQVKSITSHRFIQSLSPGKVIGDVASQVLMQFAAIVTGTVVANAAGGALAGSILPGIGSAIGFLLGYFGTYVSLNVIRAYEQQKDCDNYIKSQTAHNPDYVNERVLSSQWWNDEYYGNSIPDTLQGSPRGVYTPVIVEAGEHEFKGQVILAPRGVKKTSNYGTDFKEIILNYALHTRSYLMYSDWNDPKLTSFFFTDQQINIPYLDTEGQWAYYTDDECVENYPRDPSFIYLTNSLMFLEDAIREETSPDDSSEVVKNSLHYDRIIPYMNEYIPSLQFASSKSGFYFPEFYLNYPIFVSPDEYNNVKEEYHHIYKTYNATSDTIQIIPEQSIESEMLMSDIIKLSAYYVDTLGTEQFVADYYEFYPSTGQRTFTFNPTAGTLTFSPMQATLFEQYISNHEASHEDVKGYDGYIIFDIHVEKYRDITSTEGHQIEITLEEANKIATAQSTHASILEYLYQFIIAQDTQQRLSEIAYTAFVTITSTLITIGMSYGLGKLSGAISPTAAATQSTTSTSKVVNFLNKIVSSKSYQAVKIGLAVATETMEELYVDPWIEAYVSKSVRDAGGSGFEQVLWSSMAESGRESFVSGVVSVFNSYSVGVNARTQLQIEQSLAITPQNHISQIVQQRQSELAEQVQAERQLRSERIELISTSISSILMFAGALSGGLLGSFGSLSSVLIASSVGIDISKDIAELELKSKNIQVPSTVNIHSDTYDAQRFRIVREVDKETATNTLSDHNKPLPSDNLVKTSHDTIKTDLSYNVDPASMLAFPFHGSGGRYAGVSGPVPVSGVSNRYDLGRYAANMLKLSWSLNILLKRVAFLKIFYAGLTREKDFLTNIYSLKKFRTGHIERFENGRLDRDFDLLGDSTINFRNFISNAAIIKISPIIKSRTIDPRITIIQQYQTLYNIHRFVSILKIASDVYQIKGRTFAYIKRAYDDYLNSFGTRAKFSFEIVKIFNEHSSRSMIISEWEIAKTISPAPSILRRYGGKYIELQKHIISNPTGIQAMDTILKRLINIYRLSSNQLAKFGITTKVEEFREAILDVGIETLRGSGKITSLHSEELFKVYFYVCVAVNNKMYRNKIPSYKEVFALSQLSSHISTSQNKEVALLYLANTIVYDHHIRRDNFDKVESYLLSNSKSRSNSRKVALRSLRDYRSTYIKLSRVGFKLATNIKWRVNPGAVTTELENFIKENTINYGQVPVKIQRKILKNMKNWIRASLFGGRIIGIPSKVKSKWLDDHIVSDFSQIDEGKIIHINSHTIGAPIFVQKLIDLSDPIIKGRPLNIKSRTVTHEGVLNEAFSKIKGVIGKELSLWMKKWKYILTGHLDLIIQEGNNIFVCDYKPLHSPSYTTTSTHNNFHQDIPQVAAYCKMLIERARIKKGINVYGVIFNKDGAYVFEPFSILKSIESLMVENGVAGEINWRKFI